MKRETAYYTRIKDIVNSTYHQGEGEYATRYILINRNKAKVSRVHIWGTVVQKFENDNTTFASIVLDDTTETVKVVAFGDNIQQLNMIQTGNNVEVIGKVRERDGEKQVILEAVHKMTNPNEVLLNRAKIIESEKLKPKGEASTPEPQPKPAEVPKTTKPEPTQAEEPVPKTTPEPIAEPAKVEETQVTETATETVTDVAIERSEV